MDCCNFVPYRSPYYGTPSYYDCYPYPQEYYGHHYQDYYPAYYQQPWQCPTPFPDYVYNPKEARIRKAMREASRERAMGITPMASPRAGVRRTSTPANGWNFHGDEQQLMMNPSNGMRGIIGSSMCGSPGFSSVPTGGSGPFIPSMHYPKHVHPMSQHSSGSYMQPNPMGQLPQQHEIWHSYDDTIRNNSTGPYIVPPPMQSYHPSSMDTGSPVMHNGQPKQEVDVFPAAQEEAQPVRSNDGSSIDDQVEKIAPIRESVFDSKVDSIPSIMQAESLQTSGAYIKPYSENSISGGNYENKEEIKMRKFPSKTPKCNNSNGYKPTTKPLPDFNEAFGSTERGRFQRPPNNKGYLDYFIQQENDMKYLDFPL